MDERTFQHELHQLKQRVADMAMKKSPALPPRQAAVPDTAGDRFSSQVNNLKQHVTQLEQMLPKVPATYSTPSDKAANTAAPYLMRPQQLPPMVAQPAMPLQPDHHAAQPSDLAVWQLLMTLRDEMKRIGDRSAGIEQCVLDFEDKLDRLDPQRFTPPGSDASAEEGVERQAAYKESVDTSGGVPLDSYRHPQNEPSRPTASATVRNDHSITNNEKPHPGVSPTWTAERLLRHKGDVSRVTLDMLRKYSAKMDRVAQLSISDINLVRDIVKLHTTLAADHGWNAARLQSDISPPELSEAISPRRTSIPASELDVPESFGMQNERHPAPATANVHPEGVAFRDLEISRLDELLKNAQESARLSEQQAYQDRQALEDLQTKSEAYGKETLYFQDLYQERVDEVCKLKEEATQREQHLQQLNDYLHTRDEQRDRYLENYRQVLERSKEKTAVICSAELRIEELQKLMQDCQNGKDDEIDQMMRGREREIRRLQEFCEQKDAIAHSQEQIIARGARLMEQRDEDIEVLTRKVKALEDDYDHERRQRLRICKILEERDSQLADVKVRFQASSSAEGRTSEVKDDQPKAAIRDDPSPFTTPVRGVNYDVPSWSPRPIPGDRRLVSEARRASVWSPESANRTQPEFGKPSPIGYRRHRGAAPRRHRSSPHPRKIRYLENDQVVDTDEHGRPVAPQACAESNEVRGRSGSPAAPNVRPSNRRETEARYSLPLDRTVWPPLPAPVAVNRMQSMTDLRSTGNDEQPHRVAKHQSMQELKRKDNHAYVETEAESGGEFGAEV